MRYFVGHPNAVDDLEGIARWRLAEQAIRNSVEETHRALMWLVERGYLRLTPTVGSPPVFSLNPDKAAEAARLGAERPIGRLDEKDDG
jgi:hypothetical protein